MLLENNLKCCTSTETEINVLLTIHAANKIRADLKNASAHNNCASVDLDHIADIIPSSLYLFVEILLSNDSCDDGVVNDDTQRWRVLNTCQDIIYAASVGRKMIPKHIGIGVTIHHATRSKMLINLLCKAGNSISYDDIRRIDATLAERQLNLCDENDYAPMECNLKSEHFVHFAADNIDIIEETLDGKGTFHATQIVAYQHCPGLISDRTCQSPVLPIGNKKSLHYCQELVNHVILAPKTATRSRPRCLPDTVLKEWFQGTGSASMQKSCIDIKDLGWLLCRIEELDNQVVPAWTGFNEVVSREHVTKDQTTVTVLPLISAPAHEDNTLWTIMMRCAVVTQKLNPGCSTVRTLDQQL